MKSLDFSRYAVCSGLAAAMLAGCGGSATPISVPGTMPQSRAIASQHNRGGSWMLPEATSGDLVYAASGSDVYVYSYPGGEQVGTLTGFNDALGACSDENGNVWIADVAAGSYVGGALVEYAHAGTTPIATLVDDNGTYFEPVACSVDPSTGNLAAANSRGGGVEYPITVWTDAEGSPTYYHSTPGVAANNPFTISYYGNGDLYIRSGRYRKGEAWLPAGGSTIMQFDVKKSAYYGWDGQYFVINSGAHAKNGQWLMTLYTLNGAHGTVSKQVKLSYASCRPSDAFSIEGSELAVICEYGGVRGISYYDYPSGGNPIRMISNDAANGVTISIAPTRSRRN